MKHKEEGWGWMLAVDFFFAGMGGGMLVITGIADIFGGIQTSILGNFLGPIFIGLGAGFLILELGRPFQAWRVFMNPKAILTIGAWVMTAAIAAGILYASFGLAVPWRGWTTIRTILALILIGSGVVVATYPGILLGRHKARPFWNGPGIMGLFMISSFVTGAAAHILSSMAVLGPSSGIPTVLPGFVACLLGFQLLLWPGYLWIKSSGTTEAEAGAAQRWIKGEFALLFQAGFLVAGTLLPMIFLLLLGGSWQAGSALLTLIGGMIMRLLVVKSGKDRTWLPGEETYRSRLPSGDEPFIKAWNAVQAGLFTKKN